MFLTDCQSQDYIQFHFGIQCMSKDIVSAKITSITNATAKIKIFKLNHNIDDYQFLPGQWIDLYAPIEGKNIGGYTIISSVLHKNAIELAIRSSTNHPVTKYMHEKAQIGDKLEITKGQGQFYLPPNQEFKALTFIAGGIGITPILSMVRSLNHKQSKIKLFYSVAEKEDILFYEELKPFTVFTMTKANDPRISLQTLINNQVDFSSHFFICGPKGMIDSINNALLEFGVNIDQIHFEKWW